MKHLLFIIAIASLSACTTEPKKEVPLKTTVLCDTVTESTFDAEGNEILTSKLVCDTIVEPAN